MNTPDIIHSSAFSAEETAAAIPTWKRVFDVGVSVVLLIVFLPFLLLVAAAIKFLSPGPALFQQVRIGYRGTPFVCLKLRTMRIGANAQPHQNHCRRIMTANIPMRKLDDHGDDRLIPFARFLRAVGIDELPQLINVIRGEMSLVGPRPCLPFEYAHYQPRQKARFHTHPGLTGLWQVSGKNETTFEQMINLDIEYVRNRSLWLDLKIIGRTVPALRRQISLLRSAKKTQRNRGQIPSAVPNQTSLH